MENATYFTVVADYRTVAGQSVRGKVTFTPVLRNGDVILATDLSPRPTGLLAQTVTGKIDTDGRLKLRSKPDGVRQEAATLSAFPVTGIAAKYYVALDTNIHYRWDGDSYIEILPYEPVRLLADSELLELATPLHWAVSFSGITVGDTRTPVKVTGFTFEAPNADIVLSLIEVSRQPGQPASGITKIAPGGVRVVDGNLLQFSFDGVDIPEPVSLDAIATGAGKDLLLSTTTAGAWSVLGTVPSQNLPSYIDDVREFDTVSAFPSTGETGTIFVDKSTGNCYRWTGTAYLEISDQVHVAGIVDSTSVGRAVLQAADAAAARTAISAGALIEDALNPGFLIPQTSGSFSVPQELYPLEGVPLFLYGHSYMASDVYNSGAGAAGRWAGRVASRARMGAVTTRAANGRRSDQMARDIAAGTTAWVPKTRAVVAMCCTVNDIIQRGYSTTAIMQYRYAWQSSLALLQAKAKYASNTADFVYSSDTTWLEGTNNSPMGGKRLSTTTTGDYCQFAVTGDAVDVYLTTRATPGAGLVTFTVDGTTVGTIDLTTPVSSGGDYGLAVARLTGLGAGTKTITATLTSGAYLGVEGITIPSEDPPLVIVYGEGPVLSYLGPSVSTYNGHLTGQYLPALAEVCAEFPNVVYVPYGSGWDNTTMLRTDDVFTGDKLIHPNDKGASYIASLVMSALSPLGYSNGFNALGAQPTYTKPSAPATPSGGRTGMPIIISGGGIADDFNRSDSSSSLGSTSVGSQPWTALAGTWGISSNKAVIVSSSGECTAVVDTASADGTVEVTVAGATSTDVSLISLAFRFSDNSNGWILYSNSFGSPGNGYWRLVKKQAGAFTFYAPSVNVAPASGDVISVVLSGSSITAKVNGTTVATATDSFNSTATLHGLRAAGGATSTFDNWSFTY